MSNGTATLPEQEIHEEEHPRYEGRRRKEMVMGGTMVSGLLAAAAGILAIIGLAGAYPLLAVGIATIVLGVAFLFEGASMVGRLSGLLDEVTEGRIQMSEFGAGTTGSTFAGLTGIVLGILGILNVIPGVVIPWAAIVFGAALIIGAGIEVRIQDTLLMWRQEHSIARQISHQAVLATTGIEILGGLSAITLAILALAGIAPPGLSLAAMLSVAVVFVLSNAAIVGRMLYTLQR